MQTPHQYLQNYKDHENQEKPKKLSHISKDMMIKCKIVSWFKS